MNAFICLHALLKVLDKFTMMEKILPLLKDNRGQEPAILVHTMAIMCLTLN